MVRRGALPATAVVVLAVFVDAAGNIDTTEVDTGKRAQKLVLKSQP